MSLSPVSIWHTLRVKALYGGLMHYFELKKRHRFPNTEEVLAFPSQNRKAGLRLGDD